MAEVRIVEGAGIPLRTVSYGHGPTVLVIHDLAADADASAEVAQAIAAAPAHVITYDRRGYGGSGAPEPYGATTAEEQAQDAAALLAALAVAPAVILGEGFGALAALDLARRVPELVRALVLVDPALLQFVASGSEVLSQLRTSLEGALRTGTPGDAVASWLGPTADPARVERARTAARAFFADFGGLASLAVTRGELRAIAVPVALVVSAGAPAHVGESVARLAELLPDVRATPDGDAVAAVLALL